MIFRILFSVIIVYLGTTIHNVIMDKEVDNSSLILGAVLSAISSILYLLGMIA